MLRNYDPDIPDNPASEAGRLRRISKYLRFEASGTIPGLEDPEKIKQYKQLLFSAASQVDEAYKLLPKEKDVRLLVYPWWCWLLLGAMTVIIAFLMWIFYNRFVLGHRIGFIYEMGM